MLKLHQFFCSPRANMLCPGARIIKNRMRALDDDQKQARREAILDAAGNLFTQRHELANVADIAVAAGLAKGTVYLYFQTKEEIYIALHLRHCSQFFDPLLERLTLPTPLQFDELMQHTQRHIVGSPNYLPLGSQCSGFANGAVPADALADFQRRMTEWLVNAGSALERHFPALGAGEGARLLHHSYATILGLYNLMRADTEAGNGPKIPGMGSFEQEAQRALERLWTTVLPRPIAPFASPAPPTSLAPPAHCAHSQLSPANPASTSPTSSTDLSGAH